MNARRYVPRGVHFSTVFNKEAETQPESATIAILDEFPKDLIGKIFSLGGIMLKTTAIAQSKILNTSKLLNCLRLMMRLELNMKVSECIMTALDEICITSK